MAKVLIAYYSRMGNTEKMAEYIAEGIRLTGNSAELKKISEIKDEKELRGYDGFYLRVSHVSSGYYRRHENISIPGGKKPIW